MAAITQETGLMELSTGVFARIFPEGRTNAGFVVGDEGVFVIDSLMTPSLARGLMEDVRRVTDKPIRYLFNTHFHGDHTFGNDTFHEECRRELAEFGEESIARFATLRPEFADELKAVRICLPDLTFRDRLTIHLGPHALEILHLGRGHTAGDAAVHLPASRVLFAGDLLAARMVPYTADGYPRSWVEVASKLEALGAEQIVPGHGLMSTNEQLAAERELLSAMCAAAQEAHAAGAGVEEAARSPRLQKYVGWPRAEMLRIGVERALRELRGEL